MVQRALRAATLLAALAVSACATVNFTSPEGPLYRGGVAGVPAESEALRLVTYNIKLAKRTALAIEILRRPPLAGADILALQEMDSRGVEQMAAALGMNYVYYPSSLYRGTKREFGNAILSPWPIEEPRKLVLPHRGLIVNQLRTATVATVRVAGRALRVYAIHLGAPPVTTGGRRRAQMDVILKDAAASAEPVVILGDFNSRRVARHAAATGYTWLTRDAGPSLPTPVRSFSLDHILTRGLPVDCCVSAGVVRDAKASDHLPVWATLRLEQDGGPRCCDNPPSMAREHRKKPEELRSHRWFGKDDLRAFGHRARTKQMGFASEDFTGKPVIAILNTWSDANTCHSHFRERAEEVKRGVWQAGGFPLEMPVLSIGETYMKPSPLLYRNLLAMDAEELLRANPIDGCVLLGGCDKTVPGLLMGATSMNVPAIFVSAGPMLRGNWRGGTLGSGSDQWKYWAERRAGRLDECAWREMEDGIARSAGTCMTMGTASTMAAAAEALGMMLPGGSSIPAVDSNHPRLAGHSGRRIVEMVWEDLKPRDVLTSQAFDNAVTVTMAMGGSTNAIVHLVALAGRAGVPFDIDRFDALSRRTPFLANIRPSGKYLMEDFYYAGGIKGVMSRLQDLLHLDAVTVTGKSVRENIDGALVHNDDVIAPRERPLGKEGGVAVLRGNLAPNGAVIKHTAMEERLLRHAGQAVVFRDYNDLERRIDDPALPVTPDSVLVLQNAGPLGGPGMPEWGMLPLPKKLLEQGVRDMLRVSDARMSGTSYGACVLHVAPESFVGGPLALVQDGDVIELDVPARSLQLKVSDEELQRRRAGWKPREKPYARGYGALYAQHVTQADKGCDFDFLQGTAPTPEPEIH